MDNYREKGDTIRYANAGALIPAGNGVIVGTRLGFAATDIATGETGTVVMSGVFRVLCPTAEVITQGALLNWDNTNQEAQIAAGDLANAVVAWEDAGNGVTSLNVKLVE